MKPQGKPGRAWNATAGNLALGVVNILVVVSLLILPAIAGHQRGIDFWWAGIYAIVISAVTYWVYAYDKRRAQQGEWRVSEGRLHLLELLGGWPGAFLAQRRLRHKCSKGSYQIAFWVIVLSYQFLALDSLQKWRLSSAALNWLESSAEHQR